MPAVAVTLVVAKSTVTSLKVVPVRFTVSVIVFVLSLVDTLETLQLTYAESFVLMVTTFVPNPLTVQFVGLTSRRNTVSAFSATRSLMIRSSKLLLTSFTAKLRIPLVAK